MVAISFQDQIIKRIFQSRPDLLDAFSQIEYEIGGHDLDSYIRTVIPAAKTTVEELLWHNRYEVCRLLAKFSNFRLWDFRIQGGKGIGIPVRETALDYMNQSQRLEKVYGFNIQPCEAPYYCHTGERFYFTLAKDGRYTGVKCPDRGTGKLWIQAEQMIGKTIEECMPADLASSRRFYFDTAVKTNTEIAYCNYFMINGKWSYYEIRIIPMDQSVLMICSRLWTNNLILPGLQEVPVEIHNLPANPLKFTSSPVFSRLGVLCKRHIVSHCGDRPKKRVID